MIRVRMAEERGRTVLDWLDSRHTFSFGDYHDPRHMGYRALRVINDDRVRPGAGFGRHGHRDMEILTYVLDGALRHEDSLGNGAVLRAGDVQRMTAGTGILHSELNASATEPLRFLQIWILPEREGLLPSYEDRSFDPASKRGRLLRIASPEGREGSLTIRQDVEAFASALEPGETVSHALAPGRHAWVQVARGMIRVNDTALREGDGAALDGEPAIRIAASEPADLLLFDLT